MKYIVINNSDPLYEKLYGGFCNALDIIFALNISERARGKLSTAIESSWLDGYEPMFKIEVTQEQYDTIPWQD